MFDPNLAPSPNTPEYDLAKKEGQLRTLKWLLEIINRSLANEYEERDRILKKLRGEQSQ